jgi:hypothetical protein
MSIKHLFEKNIMVFFNTMILHQNFKNTLFLNTPLANNYLASALQHPIRRYLK